MKIIFYCTYNLLCVPQLTDSVQSTWMYNFVVAHTLYLPHKTPNKFLFFRSTIYCQKSRIHQIGLFWQKTEIAHEFDLNFARTVLNSAPFSPSSDHQLNCAKILALASRTLGYFLGVVQKLREQFLSYFDHLPTCRGLSWTFGALPTPCPRGHRKT